MKSRVLLTGVVCLATSAALAAPGAHFIENWDQDGDGIVTLGELESRRDDVFATFDANEDGHLDATEYVYFDEARANDMAENGGHGAGGQMKRATHGMTLGFNDLNADGLVSKAEFIGQTGAWLALLDRNESGDVTSDDFGKK